MSTVRRAWLYITRKRGRSLLLFAIMFVIAVFALLGLMIKSSADNAKDALRKSLCSSFILKINAADVALQKMEYGAQGQAYSVYTGPPIDAGLIDKILKINHVTDYYASYRMALWADLEFRPGVYADMYQRYAANPGDISPAQRKMGMTLDWYRVMTRNANIYGCNDSALYDSFRIGAFTLSRGRQIGEGDRYKAVISTALAQRNRLSVGDTITVEARDGIYIPADDPNKAIGEPAALEIVGLFDINFEQEPSVLTAQSGEKIANTLEIDFAENMIFCDLYALNQIDSAVKSFMGYPAADGAQFEAATFFVDDPENLDAAMSAVKSLRELDPKYFTIKPDDSAYRAAAKPLTNMGIAAAVLVAAVVAGCIVLLGLILNMWTKDRKRELGALISLGVRRRQIVLQMALENVMLAALALALAALLSGALANGAGDIAEKLASPRGTEETYIVKQDYQLNPVIDKVSADRVDLQYGLSAGNVLLAALAVLGGTALSVTVTSLNMTKPKPKAVISAH
ncbi:ABC-type transport system, involved in lipoprotein release, permease component [Sporobacter termitidis DSM 10068]|uniref:ABC-type transport system, involved in lipoprotein release, permease component n=1 Tax=Sporobacter termitidis DSM 10068 TaxID=1123282 RepID=A0A1M5Y4P4_9FIRM|nr:FtsX-like permease family protein [Sporobacter termitidis]SHI06463.1 ABC-type transport system, involved in lipoprotein release, permease component [Sporobacter termitidis DSM 10068]